MTLQEIYVNQQVFLSTIGIIQFINKSGLSATIDEYDLARIKAMSDLLGMSIDNVVEHHSVINAKVGVQEYLS